MNGTKFLNIKNHQTVPLSKSIFVTYDHRENQKFETKKPNEWHEWYKL